MTLAEIAVVVGGELVDLPETTVTVTAPPVVDSRLVTPGCLFVAFAGEQVDGHDFAAAACAAGAVAVLGVRHVGVPAVLVADPLAALSALAGQLRSRLADCTVVGVTGSSGKTSTKDLIAAAVADAGPVVATPGSYNNELGLPLTTLRADEHTRVLVLEMGARGIGQIAELCAVARPQIGAVLNVGSSHLGEFGSIEAIARAKGELVESLPPAADGGVAVLAIDDPLVAAMASRTAARVVTVGRGADAEVRAEDVRLTAGRASFTVRTPDGSAPVSLRYVGEHHVGNALVAIAVARELGLDLEQVAAQLAVAEPASHWRMEVRERPDGVTVVNDAYNANPESMAAALRALVSIGAAGRSWAVLGEMRELGEQAEAAHLQVGALAVELGVHRVVAVGAAAAPIAAGAGERGVCVSDRAAAVSLLRAELLPGDVVLVKASRAVGLEQVAEVLVAAEEARTP